MAAHAPHDDTAKPRHLSPQPDMEEASQSLIASSRLRRPSSLEVALGLMVTGLLGWVAFLGTFDAISLKFQLVALAVAVVASALVIGGYWAVKKGRLKEEHIFVVLLSFVGLLSLFVMAARTIPDETYHFQCSYKWSDILLGDETSNKEMEARACDVYLLTPGDNTLNRNSYGLASEHFELFASDTQLEKVKTVSSFSMTNNPPQIKLPSALGITLGRLLGLGAVPTYYLGRLFNLACFVVMAFFAFKWLPVGKRVLEVVCLLPMTVELAASYSYDVVIMGLSFMLTALLLRPIFGGEKATSGLMIGSAVVLFLLAPCKVVYGAIVLLVFFIPQGRFESRRAAWLWKLGLLAVALVGIAVIRGAALVSMLGVAPSSDAPSVSLRGEEAGVRYSLSLLWTDPGAFVELWANTLYVQGDFYLSTLVGGQPGWFQVSLIEPWFMVIPYLFLLALANTPNSDEPAIPAAVRAGLIAVWVITCGGVILSMMVGYTFTTEDVIQGVQGRYFLPVLPVLMLSLRAKAVQASSRVQPLVLSAALLLTVASLLRIAAIGLTIF